MRTISRAIKRFKFWLILPITLSLLFAITSRQAVNAATIPALAGYTFQLQTNAEQPEVILTINTQTTSANKATFEGIIYEQGANPPSGNNISGTLLPGSCSPPCPRSPYKITLTQGPASFGGSYTDKYDGALIFLPPDKAFVAGTYTSSTRSTGIIRPQLVGPYPFSGIGKRGQG